MLDIHNASKKLLIDIYKREKVIKNPEALQDLNTLKKSLQKFSGYKVNSFGKITSV